MRLEAIFLHAIMICAILSTVVVIWAAFQIKQVLSDCKRRRQARDARRKTYGSSAD